MPSEVFDLFDHHMTGALLLSPYPISNHAESSIVTLECNDASPLVPRAMFEAGDPTSTPISL